MKRTFTIHTLKDHVAKKHRQTLKWTTEDEESPEYQKLIEDIKEAAATGLSYPLESVKSKHYYRLIKLGLPISDMTFDGRSFGLSNYIESPSMFEETEMKPEDYLEDRFLRIAQLVKRYSERENGKKIINLRPYGLDLRVATLFSKLPNVQMSHYRAGGFCATEDYLRLTITELKNDQVLDEKKEDEENLDSEYPLGE